MEETGTGVKAITALQRGLDVLLAIERASAIGLADLHRQTAIPKASLLRILKTLQQAGRVGRDEESGRYLATPPAGHATDDVRWRARLSELVTPAWNALQRRVSWPIDIAIRDGVAMLILDMNGPSKGLAVNYRALGLRPSMLVSSLGRCYLAFCPDDERRAILAALARSPHEIDRAAKRQENVRRMVSHGRQQGYVLRDPSETSIHSPERFGAISVPVFHQRRVAMCLSCSWLPDVASVSDIVGTYLPQLRTAAGSIEQRLLRSGFSLPPP